MATLPSPASSPTTTAAAAPPTCCTPASHHAQDDDQERMATSMVVGVQATFYTQPSHTSQPVETHAFTCLTPVSQVPPCTTPAPLNDTDVPPYEAGSSAYSGRHDGGLLPPLRQAGVWGAMVQAAAEAKADSDEYLTGVIGGEGGREEEGEEEEGMEVVEDGGEEEEGEGEMDTSSLPKKGKDKTKVKELVGVGAGGGRIGSKSGLKKPKI